MHSIEIEDLISPNSVRLIAEEKQGHLVQQSLVTYWFNRNFIPTIRVDGKRFTSRKAVIAFLDQKAQKKAEAAK